jgi:hypothetical protein
MLQSRYVQIACSLAALATGLTLAPSASADLGHRFVATVHGGVATEAGAGATAEVRVLEDFAFAAGFDGGVNFKGLHGSYSYLGPALGGSYRFKFSDMVELRPILGARFPVSLRASDPMQYTISDYTPVAFTGALRLMFIFDNFVVGLQGDVTPHDVTWMDVVSRKTENTEEVLVRASLVIGIAIGKDAPDY